MKLLRLVGHIFVKVAQLFDKKTPDTNTHIYVALGDSTVEGIGATEPTKTYPALLSQALEKKYQRVEYYNLGKAGAKTKDLIDFQLKPTIAIQPNLITISIGGNDIFRRVRKKTFEQNLNHIIHTLKRETSAEIIINTIPAFTATRVPPILKSYCQIRAKQFNTVIKKIAAAHNILVVDIYHHVHFLAKNKLEIVCEDGLHPSNIGYAAWASSIINTAPAIFADF